MQNNPAIKTTILQFLIVCVFIVSAFSGIAQTVEQDEALIVAQNFYHSNLSRDYNLKSAKNISFNISETVLIKSESELKSAKNIPAFHIVNIGENDGFILVSGDERSQPILGYSMNGNFKTEELTEHIKSFFKNFQNEISDIIENDPNIALTPNNKWDELKNGYTKSGVVNEKFNLISTNWGQGKFYNNMCPEDSRMTSSSYNGHVPTGCVATVMSQLLNYWSWPSSGTGTTCYTPSTYSEYGEQCANFESTDYNYSAMPDMVNDVNNDIARLIYHTAVAVKMNFTPSGSSTYSTTTTKAFKNNFRFSEKAEFVYKSKYADSEWTNLLKNHLNNGIPLYYRGDYNGSSAHAFICDGYDPDGRFHFNWGWDGRFNGYFAITAMDPMNNYNYNSNQGAIINLFPLNNDFLVDELSSEKPNLIKNEEITFSYNQVYNGADFNDLPVTFEYWLSENNTLDNNDILLGFDETLLSSENNLVEISKSLTLTENVEEGNLNIIVCVKSENIEDINISNNQQTLEITIENNRNETGSNTTSVCSDELEPNNNDYESFYVGNEAAYNNSSLCLSEGDEDWFEFTINSETYFAKIALSDNSLHGFYGVEFSFSGEGIEILTFETEGISDTKIWLFDSELQLIAEDDNGGDDPFARLFYRPNSSTTSASIFESGNINVYPNPVKQKVYINSDIQLGDDVTITLLDIRGTLLETKTFDNTFFNREYSLDLTPYTDGQYIVRIYSANGDYVAKKIMKNSWI
ncbi:MAG: thiol protease/hemagglutinin PrtT [Mariniphaga sp.]|nr:thiol protease/hemagglutinin PrtT [Mariniphaga sp.]